METTSQEQKNPIQEILLLVALEMEVIIYYYYRYKDSIFYNLVIDYLRMFKRTYEL